MSVYACYPLVASGLEQFGTDDLLTCQHDTMLGSDTDTGTTILNRLHSIFDLEITTIGGED